jgi:hypothetical protein
MLIQHLQGQPHLLILDSLDALTEPKRSRLSREKQAAIQRFLADLVSSRVFILLGSREDVNWLAPGTFNDNIYALGGLDPDAVATLVSRILERYGAMQYSQDEHLQKLLQHLNGIPLSLETTLAKLAHQAPEQLLSDLQAAP